MSAEKRQVRNFLPVYVAGAAKNGWCCCYCHREFGYQQKPLKTFGRFMVHRLLSHRLFRFQRATGVTCHVTHTTKPHFSWTALPPGWTATGTVTFGGDSHKLGDAS